MERMERVQNSLGFLISHGVRCVINSVNDLLF